MRTGRPLGPMDARRLLKVRALRAKGLTYREIAQRLAISLQSVAQYLRRHAAVVVVRARGGPRD
jgi:DNA-binding NarL/FixJ family response regulator